MNRPELKVYFLIVYIAGGPLLTIILKNKWKWVPPTFTINIATQDQFNTTNV